MTARADLLVLNDNNSPSAPAARPAVPTPTSSSSFVWSSRWIGTSGDSSGARVAARPAREWPIEVSGKLALEIVLSVRSRFILRVAHDALSGLVRTGDCRRPTGDSRAKRSLPPARFRTDAHRATSRRLVRPLTATRPSARVQDAAIGRASHERRDVCCRRRLRPVCGVASGRRLRGPRQRESETGP